MWLAAILAAFVPQAGEAPHAEAVYFDVPLPELELLEGAELPVLTDGWWRAPSYADMTPYATVEGAGRALVHGGPEAEANARVAGPIAVDRLRLAVRALTAGEVRGTLFLPNAEWTGMTRLAFRLAPELATASPEAFERAESMHYARLLADGRAGAAWFRHQLGERPPDPTARSVTPDDDLLRTFALFSGGRAIAENLQLDRALPNAEDAERTVPMDGITGVTVREFDWSELTPEEPAERDPLATLIPADQFGLFFASFQAFADVLDESSTYGDVFLTAYSSRSTDAHTQARIETQLGVKMDALGRLFGSMAIDGVAITASDPYLRSGTDVAVLLQVEDPPVVGDILLSWLGSLAMREGAELEAGEVGAVEYHGAVSRPVRRMCSYVAAVENAVILTNSLVQLERIVAVGAGSGLAMADSPEYRFFRHRYPRRSSAEEAGLLVVPDAAIRRWCGPRWRIGSSRRTRAAALLADLQATHLDAIDAARAGAEGAKAIADAPAFLGDVTLTGVGVHSSVYGSLAFLTPIAELDLDRATPEEERLYGLWRDGYQRNWSAYFDPIALQLSVGEAGAGIDVTVMPLIMESEYGDLIGLSGEEVLEPTDGDPHAESIVHFVLALDPASEAVQSYGQSIAMFGDPMGWMGGSIAVYLDQSEFVDRWLASEDPTDFDLFLGNELNELPLAVSFEVASSMKLAAFVAAVRSFVDGTSPGVLEWTPLERDGHGYVRITAKEGVDASIFYATTPAAWILSTNESTLLSALSRQAERKETPEEEAPRGWLGESAALELGRAGIDVLAALLGEELQRELRAASWNNLPILNEWRRLRRSVDPVAYHAELWGETLRCAGGGEYVWNEEWQTMESTVYGHPGSPRAGARLPPAWSALEELRFGITFENDGLRARVAVAR